MSNIKQTQQVVFIHVCMYVNVYVCKTLIKKIPSNGQGVGSKTWEEQ